jgi:hypothetical protein
MRFIVGAIDKKMDAWIANIRDDQKERTSCQEMMGGTSRMQEANLSGHEGPPRDDCLP